MKILICTQIVDADDSNLGFFVRWIEEFARHAEKVEVICLKKGTAVFPSNVTVHSLGKERGPEVSVVYAYRFLRLCFRLRNQYDSVFVHMNPEYVVLGGLWWRWWGKRVALWYTHSSVTLSLRIATRLSHVLLTASRESLRVKSNKVHVMGHGIDTAFFAPDASVARGAHVLSVGRLSPSKHHDLAIRAAARAGREIRVIGDGPERKRMEEVARETGATVRFVGGVNQMQLRDEYRRAAFLIHASTTGSLDKVVLEALACDTPVLSIVAHLYEALPVQKVEATPESIAEALERPPSSEPRAEAIRETHSLQRLIPAIIGLLS